MNDTVIVTTQEEMDAVNVPQRFTKRPVTIEAARLTGTPARWREVYLWVEANTLGSFEPLDVIEGRKPYPPSGVSIDPRDGRLIISTLEGLHWAGEGDWIIRGAHGEFYPVKNEIFEATYQPAAEHHGEPNADDPPDAEIEAVADVLEGLDGCDFATIARAALLAAREVAGR